MVKQDIYSFKGMIQDIAKNKYPKEYYFDAKNIRITVTESQSAFSVINEKGNSLIFDIPTINIDTANKHILFNNKISKYKTDEINNQVNNNLLPTVSNNQEIINITQTRDNFILFTTDGQMDCIWLTENLLLNAPTELKLIYVRNLGFSKNFPIQTVFNYENTNIQKVYWVDGKTQVKFILVTPEFNIINNTEYTIDIIDLPLTNLNMVSDVKFTQPEIIDISSGGSHTSGMIQYAYNLYRLNGSQTKISPLTELVPLDKGDLGGGELNEIVGSVPIVKIKDIDENYTHIKVYSVKYTSFNEIPQIQMIDDREIDSQREIIISDDGRGIETLSLEEFVFLGSSPVVPKHIERQDNILFLGNIKDKFFDLPDEFDMRAYSFPLNSTETEIVDNITGFTNKAQGNITKINSSFNLDIKSDAVNRDYKTQKYQFNSNIIGGEGKYLKYEIHKLNQLGENISQDTNTEIVTVQPIGFTVTEANYNLVSGFGTYIAITAPGFPFYFFDVFAVSSDNIEYTIELHQKTNLGVDTIIGSATNSGTGNLTFEVTGISEANLIFKTYFLTIKAPVGKIIDSISFSLFASVGNTIFKLDKNTQTTVVSTSSTNTENILIDSDIELSKRNKYFKDNELYRIGIEFYNKLGQISLPKWIADFIAPEGNLSGSFNALKVTLKPEFYTLLNNFTFESEDDKPIGYKIIRANRTMNDRLIIAQGALTTMMVNSINTSG